jgi:hypothetical protein
MYETKCTDDGVGGGAEPLVSESRTRNSEILPPLVLTEIMDPREGG